MQRHLPALGLTGSGDYRGNTLEFGVETRYDARRERKEKAAPYAAWRAVRYGQDAYGESGAGVYGQNVDELRHTYSEAELGLRYEKRLARGSFDGRIGYRRALSGENPTLAARFAGDPDGGFTVRGNRVGKNAVVVSIGGAGRLTEQLSLTARLQSEIGGALRSTSASAMLRYAW